MNSEYLKVAEFLLNNKDGSLLDTYLNTILGRNQDPEVLAFRMSQDEFLRSVCLSEYNRRKEVKQNGLD